MYLQYRRFLNLVVHDLENTTYSLYRMNTSKHLFYPSPPHAEAASAKKNTGKKIERWNSLTRPEIRFEKPPIFSAAMTDSRILLPDSAGRNATYDTSIDSFGTLPSFNSSKGPNSICFSICEQGVFYHQVSRRLYVMDLFPGTGKNPSFELLSYTEDNVTSFPAIASNFPRTSYWRDLPPPPFLGDPAYQSSANVFSSTVVNAKTISVSAAKDGLGTYNFDTESRVWSPAGKWALPFYGKAEHVPELNLWFGLSLSSPHCLCGFDLSTMDHDRPPVVQHTWDYLEPVDLPEPYQRYLVNMRSGRFCIVSFFRSTIDEEFVIFTGVQLVPCKNAEAPVHMIKHKSKRFSFKSHRIKFVI